MAKAILEFDLNEIDEQMSHLRAIKSLDMALVLWELVYNTKKQICNEIEFENLHAYDAIDRLFEKIHSELNDRGLNMDQLIV